MFTQDMWQRVVWLQKKIEHKYPDDLRLKHIISCLQLTKEVSEILDCIPWKFERGMNEISREKLLEELVDGFRYFSRLLYIHSITEKEFQEAFIKKSKIVERRLINEEYKAKEMGQSLHSKVWSDTSNKG